MQRDKKGYPLLIICSAILIVFALSLVHWSQLTGGKVKDYDLVGDLLVDSLAQKSASLPGDEVIDEEYVKALEESGGAGAMLIEAIKGDSLELNPARVDSLMVIEDYTPGRQGLKNLKQALANGKARIAIIGDSYIEGDIFSQDIRKMLQTQYGGKGVGYVPAHSLVGGFRRTVLQSDDGWTQVPLQKATGSKYFSLMGEHFIGGNGATVTYKGIKDEKLSKWNESRLLFVAPNGGKITLYTATDTVVADVPASLDAQSLVVEGETNFFKVKTNASGLVFLGAYLDGKEGVSVDCMSIRGDSGITHRKLNTDLAAQMRKYVDYDLIIVEYGINALSAKQENYDSYGSMMVDVVKRLRECYPNADILMLGIGDRGQKLNGEVHSLSTAPAMTAAQRKAAQTAGCLFWDTREAMGGEDAIVDWRTRKLVNADYIHLNSAGGKELAGELVGSINRSMGK